MIETGLWQEHVVQEMIAFLQPDPDVLALVLFGSAVQSQVRCDVWSDVDVLLVIKNKAVNRFYPTTDWLTRLGTPYAYEQSSNAFRSTTRVCFNDMRRLDLVVTTDSNLKKMEDWPQHPFEQGVEVVFSRAAWVEKVLSKAFERPEVPLISNEQFEEMVNRFWYKGVMVVYKVVRNDLLIALHLALDLVRDCCLLGMMLRDRDEGTVHHREGGIGNQMVTQLRDAQRPYTAIGILEIVEQSGIAFDRLASRWSESYEEKRQPLLEWIERAKEMAVCVSGATPYSAG